MTRRPWLALLGILLAAAGAMTGIVLTGQRERGAPEPNAGRAKGLTLVIVETDAGSYGAVVGSTGAADGALVVPGEIQVTIPGQGEATLGEALELPPREAATTVANVLGVWVDHYVVIPEAGLRAMVRRAGGIGVGGDVKSGPEAVGMLDDAGEGGTSGFALVLGGLLAADVGWEPSDVAESDAPSAVIESLDAARGAAAMVLPVVQAAEGVYVAEPEAVRAALVQAFGGPDRDVVPVIVLNGSGMPGVGELVAERIVPAGFRIVVSENASNFDHDETLVVVGSSDDVALAERVRDLLDAGSVNVSVSSGIAPVTVVVGKDFTG